jgi:thiamine biosynthesis lipoprotein
MDRDMILRPHILLCLLFAVLLCSCQQRKDQPVRATFNTMGTFAAVSLPYAERDQLTDCAELAEKRMAQLNNSLSTFRTNSEVSRISQLAGTKSVSVSKQTYDLLVESKTYGALSGGAFDVTVAPLLTLWGLRGDGPASIPSQSALQATRAKVGWQHLVLSDNTAFLDTVGMKLDLGGIAKGYAVDRCYEDLQARGATNILVDLGGNIRCSGFSRGRIPWMIGIRYPFDKANRLVGKIALTSGLSTATSGNYEQYVEIAGERYTHIIDPRTGHPVKGMASVTVVCNDGLQADAMSTVLFVLGMEDSPKLLARMKDCAALLIPDKRPIELWATSSFLDRFTVTDGFKDRVFVIASAEGAETALVPNKP